MSKLPEDKKFFDFSDYARPFAVALVRILLPTKIGAYTITFAFLIVGLFASYLIYSNNYLVIAAALILVKSMLDAADGEIARRRNEPSIVGRYLDSIFDFVVNLFLFLSIALLNQQSMWLMIISLFLFQLQGSIFNYYYLVKRYQVNGDRTSRIFESKEPKPLKKDNPGLLRILHKIYMVLYGWQDFLIFKFDPGAIKVKELPNWYLTLVSSLGLGFQLLIISVMLIFNIHEYTIDFFILPYSILGLLIIQIRRLFVQ
jgi:hypothetical protein